MHRFFIEPDNVKGDKIHIYGGDVNHMKNVLRMKVGEQLEVCDSSGMVYVCKIEKYDDDCEKNQTGGGKIKHKKDSATLAIEDSRQSDSELPSKIYLFQGLPKSDKMELIIQKSVELGVHEVIPVATARVIVKLDEKKATKKIERWSGISESAAKQSGRSYIPEIKPIMSLDQALKYSNEIGIDVVLIPYELAEGIDGTKNIIKNIKNGQSIGVFIGPEGGFDKTEVEEATKSGAVPVSLGKRILRTETAGLTILSILMYEISS